MPTRTYTVEVYGHRLEIQAPSEADAVRAAQEWGRAHPPTPQDVMRVAQRSLWEAGAPPPQAPPARSPAQADPEYWGARPAPAPQQSDGYGVRAQPHARRPVPPPNPRDPSTIVPWVLGQAHNAGLNAAEAITHRSPDPAYRHDNPVADAPAGFGQGLIGAVGNMAFSAIDPASARNTAQSTVNHLFPVAIGTLNGTPGAQQSELIRQLEQQRLAAGDYTTGERAAPMLPDYRPSTDAGAFGERAGAAALNVAVPGAMLPTVLGFGAGEGAAAIAANNGANPDQVEAARFGGNTLGSLAALPFTGPRPVDRRMRSATQQLDLSGTPGTDLALARALMERSRDLPGGGLTLYGDEALSQVAGTRGAPLQAAVRQASRAPSGSRAASQQMANRPQQIHSATMGTADLIAPPITDPAALGVRAQTAASDALGATRAEINSVARPSYDALRGVQLPEAEFETLMQNPSFREALQQVTSNRELRPLLQVGANGEIPLNDLNTLNLVQTQLRTLAENAREAPTNPQGNNTIAHMRDTAAAQLDAAASAASPHWTNARGVVSQGRAGVLAPEQAGPLGDIGGRPNAPAQADAQAASLSLYPRTPPEGMPNVTVQALRAMEAQDAGVGADLTRLRLVDALEQGTRRLQGGENPRGGANVANNIAGTPTAGATFRAGVQEVAPVAVPTVNDLIEALQASGTRAPEGSQTATDTAGMADFGGGHMALEAGRTIVNPKGAFGRASDFLARVQLNRNAGQFMDILALPPDEFAAYMRGLPSAGARNRGLGLVKALMAGQAVENQ